jgi:hypothetical protein
VLRRDQRDDGSRLQFTPTCNDEIKGEASTVEKVGSLVMASRGEAVRVLGLGSALA